MFCVRLYARTHTSISHKISSSIRNHVVENGGSWLPYPVILIRTGAVSLGDKAMASIGETDKPSDQFRSYTEDVMDGLVMATYQTINTRQTVNFVQEQHDKWGKLGNKEATMAEVGELALLIRTSSRYNSGQSRRCV